MKKGWKSPCGGSVLLNVIAILTALIAGVVLITGVWFAIRFSSGGGTVRVLEAKNVSKGDVVRMGTFEQDGDSENGAEEIEWIVLDVQPAGEDMADTGLDTDAETALSAEEDDGTGLKALLISRDVLQAIPLHNVYEDITWDKCSLRSWLNDEFYNESFSDEEKDKILTSKNLNHSNPEYDSKGCGTTEDQAFILSLEEAKAYLRTDEDYALIGAADGTEYAKVTHLEVGEESTEEAGKACWWLRTPGVYQYSAAFVDRDGTIFENGAIANHETYCGVRPSVWVEIDS